MKFVNLFRSPIWVVVAVVLVVIAICNELNKEPFPTNSTPVEAQPSRSK